MVNGLKSLLVTALLFSFGCSVMNTPADAQLNPYKLRCEYLAEADGIDVTAPRLSWKLASTQNGQLQTAYQILVASSKDKLTENKADLWNSGKVQSDDTLHIIYAGKPLTSFQQCFWSLRVWDKDGKASSWTTPESWSMGVLDQDQWQGKWLSGNFEYNTKELTDLKGPWKQKFISPMFRKAFSLDKKVKRASLYICGLGYHEAYLNGQKVGDHVLDPAFTRYDESCLYVTHEVTDMVSSGKNAIGIMLGNGWYNVFCRAAWDFDKAAWRNEPTVKAMLRIEYNDGSTKFISTDKSWKAAPSPVIMDGIRQGESYDARMEQPGWCTATFDDTKWASPVIVDGPKGKLRAQMAPPIKVTQTITPKAIKEVKPGVFVYDLGQNIAGFAKIKLSGPAGTKVVLRYSEKINKDGSINQEDIARHVYEPRFSIDEYVLKGEGVEEWMPRFVYHGFQYVEVTGFPGTPKLENLTGCVAHTDFENIGTFTCSDENINRIQQCTLWSYRGNFHGHPTDCPHREKNGWMGDAHLAAEQAMYNFANGGGYTKWMMDIFDEQKDDGSVPGIVPTGGWGYAWGNGPAWDSAYFIIPWEMYRYLGDTRILATHYDHHKRYVDYLTNKRSENLIVSFGLGDWVPAKTKTPENVTSTAFYYIDTVILAKSAALLGKVDDAKKYADLAEKIKASYNKSFYKGDGIYANGSQTALSFSLHAGLVPDSERSKVVTKLAENVRKNGNHIDTGILGAKSIFNMLSENGQHQAAYDMLMVKGIPGYMDWLRKGATTLWEDWPKGSSQNHIMFGDISAWFYKNLAGINLDPDILGNEAFKQFIIRPRPIGDLTNASAEYDSMRGLIKSSWTIENGTFTLNVTIPANTTATVYVPVKDKNSILAPTTISASEMTAKGYVDGYYAYSVNSGSYTFKTKIK